MLETWDRPPLVRSVPLRLAERHGLEVVLDDAPGFGPEGRERPAPAGRHDRVAVRRRVERPEAPVLAVGERDVAIAPAVESGEALRCPLADLEADDRGTRVVPDDARDLQHGCPAGAHPRCGLDHQRDPVVGRERLEKGSDDGSRHGALIPAVDRVEDDQVGGELQREPSIAGDRITGRRGHHSDRCRDPTRDEYVASPFRRDDHAVDIVQDLRPVPREAIGLPGGVRDQRAAGDRVAHLREALGDDLRNGRRAPAPVRSVAGRRRTRGVRLPPGVLAPADRPRPGVPTEHPRRGSGTQHAVAVASLSPAASTPDPSGQRFAPPRHLGSGSAVRRRRRVHARPPRRRPSRRSHARRATADARRSAVRLRRRDPRPDRSTARTAPGSCSSRSRTSTARLHQLGGRLVVRRGDWVESVVDVVARSNAATAVHVSDDVSGYARDPARATRDHAPVSTSSARRASPWSRPARSRPADSGDHYKVFTPYFRRWSEARRRARRARARRSSSCPPASTRARCPALADLVDGDRAPDVVPGGATRGPRAARRVDRSRSCAAYADRHDDLPGDATSRLSPYLHFGCLSPLEVLRAAAATRARAPTRSSGSCAGATSTRQILAARPDAAWSDYRRPRRPRGATTPTRSQAWQDGPHRLPGRRRRDAPAPPEGFMHNRARMVVASFLTKDLYVDWRVGARHFLDLPRRRRPREEQPQLAVGRRHRHRHQPAPRVQPDRAGHSASTPTATTCAATCPSSAPSTAARCTTPTAEGPPRLRLPRPDRRPPRSHRRVPGPEGPQMTNRRQHGAIIRPL